MKTQIIQILIPILLMGCGGTGHAQNTNKESASDNHDHASGHSDQKAGDQRSSKSPRTAAMASIGPVHVHIDYSSPSVRGRTIWGGLVAYGEVWVTGAHKATSINIPADVRINGNEVKAGKYGLFTIPEEDQWTIILNSNFDQHLADDYDAKLDVLRLQVEPTVLEHIQEELKYTVTGGESKGSVSIQWETIEVQFEIEIN